jgi:hypothetical protein
LKGDKLVRKVEVHTANLAGSNPDQSRESGGLATLAKDAAALSLRRATPDPLALTTGEGVLKTHGANWADSADSLSLGRVGVVLAVRIKDV